MVNGLESSFLETIEIIIENISFDYFYLVFLRM